MKRFIRFLSLAATFVVSSHAIDSNSSYTQLSSDYLVTDNTMTGQVVLQQTLTLTAWTQVFFEADGRFFPHLSYGLATMEIRKDGSRISNASILDFRTIHPMQHAFNCIAQTWVAPGTHTIQLVGYNHPSVQGGMFYVGATTNLSVVVNPSTEGTNLAIANDSGEINVATLGFHPPGPLAFVTVLSAAYTASAAPIVLLSSGRVFDPLNKYGDALWGTYINGACPSNAQQQWSVNDLSLGSETHTPMFGQALYSNSGTVTIQLAATELPYESQGIENPVEYLVGSTTTLVALSGNIPIHGGAAQVPSGNCAPNTYVGAGLASQNFWTTSFTVSSGQNGNVMFLAKTRVGDCTDSGPGEVKLQLVLDGNFVGSVGVQDFFQNETCHGRTIGASYLALHLSPGTHMISGNVKTTGLPNLAASGDLGLIFFGN